MKLISSILQLLLGLSLFQVSSAGLIASPPVHDRKILPDLPLGYEKFAVQGPSDPVPKAAEPYLPDPADHELNKTEVANAHHERLSVAAAPWPIPLWGRGSRRSVCREGLPAEYNKYRILKCWSDLKKMAWDTNPKTRLRWRRYLCARREWRFENWKWDNVRDCARACDACVKQAAFNGASWIQCARTVRFAFCEITFYIPSVHNYTIDNDWSFNGQFGPDPKKDDHGLHDQAAATLDPFGEYRWEEEKEEEEE
ncbi:hypothetical protein S40293_10939 [Stachybotrys chartarum IBT 40293]|nr:hypothetical protein S40293_10939 [Stachybotrys chartarum IBT 40293]